MKAGGANSTSVECVPRVEAVTRPEIVFAGRPTAEWAPDARAGGVEALLFIQFAINNNGGLVVREGTHAAVLCHALETRGSFRLGASSTSLCASSPPTYPTDIATGFATLEFWLRAQRTKTMPAYSYFWDKSSLLLV